MAMNLRPMLSLRWALPVFLCLGLSGLGGCSSRYHPQHASAIGGGHIGKGRSGKAAKKRGGSQQSGDPAVLFAGPHKSDDPFDGLGETKRGKSGTAKSSGSRAGVAARAPRPKPDPNLFDTGARAPRKRASDPFNDL